MSEHTPGPWKVYFGTAPKSRPTIFGDGGNGSSVCFLSRPYRETASNLKRYQEAEANAHLIAAAPTMKEALQFALSHVSELRDAWARGVLRESDTLGGTRSNRNVDVECVLLDALAKAEGQ